MELLRNMLFAFRWKRSHERAGSVVLIGLLLVAAIALGSAPASAADTNLPGGAGAASGSPSASPAPAGGSLGTPTSSASGGSGRAFSVLGPLFSPPAPEAPVNLPPPPVVTPASPLATPPVFGSNMFNGRFSAEQFSGFNPQYTIHAGDQITLRMWGAFTYDATVTVDPQGNIFVPNVGPVNVLGVRNGDLNRHIEGKIRTVYRAVVGVYASLLAAQQVKVYVTGFVLQPGLYAGMASDSLLFYLDKAGGIDPARGSYLDVTVLRGGRLRANFDLYEFLLRGEIEPLQLSDGDTIVVGPRKYSVTVSGEVTNPYQFELRDSDVPVSRVLALARPKASATHVSIVRKQGPKIRSEYHPLERIEDVVIHSGDEVVVTADKYPGTILVRIEGANLGQHALVLPYGARLRDAFARTKPAPQANLAAAQLFRKSVALRQKEMLDRSLQTLQTMVLTPRSSTSEEADLRQKDAALALQYLERAKSIQPLGQVVLGPKQDTPNVLLEDGDVIRIPAASNLVMIHGEVIFPNAVVYDPEASVDDYIEQAGGYTQSGSNSQILIVHQDGSFSMGCGTFSMGCDPRPGDEIMVMPNISTKNWEFARTIAQILFYLGVAARVVL